MREDSQIRDMGIAAHRNAGHAKPQNRREFGERFRRAIAPGDRIGDHSHFVPARRLLPRQIDDVPEQSAQGSPQHMQDAKLSIVGRV